MFSVSGKNTWTIKSNNMGLILYWILLRLLKIASWIMLICSMILSNYNGVIAWGILLIVTYRLIHLEEEYNDL